MYLGGMMNGTALRRTGEVLGIGSLLAGMGIYIFGFMFLVGGAMGHKIDLKDGYLPVIAGTWVLLVLLSAWFTTVYRGNQRFFYGGMAIGGLTIISYINLFNGDANYLAQHMYCGIPLGILVALALIVYSWIRTRRRPHARLNKEHFTPSK
jgi:hypothetical protein